MKSLNESVDVLKSLGELTRLRIIKLFLFKPGTPLCVCEIVDSLEVPQYTISKHLKILKYCGLVSETKDGRWVYYSLETSNEPFFIHLCKAVESLSYELLKADEQRLKERLNIRENGQCVFGITKPHLMS